VKHYQGLSSKSRKRPPLAPKAESSFDNAIQPSQAHGSNGGRSGTGDRHHPRKTYLFARLGHHRRCGFDGVSPTPEEWEKGKTEVCVFQLLPLVSPVHTFPSLFGGIPLLHRVKAKAIPAIACYRAVLQVRFRIIQLERTCLSPIFCRNEGSLSSARTNRASSSVSRLSLSLLVSSTYPVKFALEDALNPGHTICVFMFIPLPYVKLAYPR
jgi:hypothetical protein